MSQEQKLKLSQAHKGRTFSEEHKRKLSESHKGKIPTNLEQLRQYRKGRPLSAEHKQKIADAQKGKPKNLTDEARKIMSEKKKGHTPWNKGVGNITTKCLQCGSQFQSKKFTKRKYCCVNCKTKHQSGENHYKWIKDRNNLSRKQERNDSAYGDWRKTVLNKYNYKCAVCQTSYTNKHKLEVHHILAWKSYPELRYNTENGISLCHMHHMEVHRNSLLLDGYIK